MVCQVFPPLEPVREGCSFAVSPRVASHLAGVEMLECLKPNFFPDEDVPLKWESGVAPPVAQYMDQISLTQTVLAAARNLRREIPALLICSPLAYSAMPGKGTSA
jgi:hypothetical protein